MNILNYFCKKTKTKSSRPIGIFDSGVGGLTVANAIQELLPNENIIYFGDTANMPYGDKSKEDIQFYSIKITTFLREHNCKLILIACNSATAAAYDFLKATLPENVILMNVVDPAIAYLAEKYADKRIGLIATQQTIHSKIYDKKIAELNSGIELSSLATRVLAPAIEDFDNDLLFEMILKEYLSNPVLQNIDAILLGCTHYPMIKKNIAKFYEDKVDIIDTSFIVAQAVKDELIKRNIYKKASRGKKEFFISKYSDSFISKVKSSFCKDEIFIQQYVL